MSMLDDLREKKENDLEYLKRIIQIVVANLQISSNRKSNPYQRISRLITRQRITVNTLTLAMQHIGSPIPSEPNK